jgi:predicted alpha/beta-hydrolase family hydrolase
MQTGNGERNTRVWYKKPAMETTAKMEPVQIPVTPEITLSGVLGIPEWWPTGQRVGVVIAHDTNATMDQDLVVTLHRALADRGDLTLRFNFPYAEAGKKRPDGPTLLQRALRAGVAYMMSNPQKGPARLVLVGHGLGGRVAAEVVAQGMKSHALLLLNYPLHPVGKPGQIRAEALFRIICPMLFIQGTKDPTCRLDRLRDVLRRIGAPTSLQVVEDADHNFGVAKRSPRTLEEVHEEVIAWTDRFISRVTGPGWKGGSAARGSELR